MIFKLFCLAALASAASASAQSVVAELAPGQWKFEVEQSRLSSVIDGVLIDDESAPVLHATDRVDTWARNRFQLSWKPQDAFQDLQWTAFVDAQLHMFGTGAQAVARINSGRAGGAGESYGFDLDSVQYRRLGVSAMRTLRGNATGAGPDQWTVGASAFAVDQFKSLDARGALSERAAGNIGLQALVTQNKLSGTSPFIQPGKVLGWGVGLDVSALWGSLDGSFLQMAVRDLGPSVRLSQVLGIDQIANTDTLSFDANGYVQLAPALRGAYTNRALSFRIKPEAHLVAGFREMPGRRWLAWAVQHGARQEIGLGVQQVVGATRMDVGLHLLSHMPASLSVGVSGQRWGVVWRGDQLQPAKARIWSLSGSFSF